MSSPQIDDALLTLVATLYYQDGLSQNKVAQIADVSQSKISRLLTQARERGLVRITVAPYLARNEKLEQKCLEKFGLMHAVVIHVLAGQQIRSRQEMIGYYAAPVVRSWLQTNDRVCLSAGRTLFHLIHELARTEPVHGLTIMQTMGSIEAEAQAYDAIELARLLAASWNAKVLQLQAPAIAADRAERDSFMQHHQIRDVLKKITNSRLALVGVGIPTDSVFIERDFFHTADAARLKTQGAVGEICGRFFDENGHECKTDYRDRVIGLDLHQLVQIPKVVACVCGSNRAAAIRAAIRGKLIKSLITDEETMTAVLELVH